MRGDLGRYPAVIRIIQHSLKDWFRISTDTKISSVIYDTYLCNMIYNNKMSCWWSNIKKCFKENLGLNHILENHGGRNKE